MFYLICAWINIWENNREAGDLRRHRAHYDVIVIQYPKIAKRTLKTRDALMRYRSSTPIRCQAISYTNADFCKSDNQGTIIKKKYVFDEENAYENYACKLWLWTKDNVDGLVQDCSIAFANAPDTAVLN